MPIGLDPAADERGFRVETLTTVASTNEQIFVRAEAGDPGHLWIVADEQTAGRGRLGRHWASPPGNLYATLLLIDPCAPRHAPELGFVAGVALADALLSLGAPPDAFGLKWPNDLVSGGAKFSGLLLEARRVGQRTHIAIGVGVNCQSHPTGLPYQTTDLSHIFQRRVTPADLFAPLSRCMAERLAEWSAGTGFSLIRKAWLAVAAGLGTEIEVVRAGERLRGGFETIDEAGRLLLRRAEGLVAVDAGDVLLA